MRLQAKFVGKGDVLLMDEKRMKEVFSEKAFVERLLELDDPVEVQAALREKGVDLTEGEIIVIRDEIARLADKIGESGELSLDQLDEVAGGSVTITTGIVLTVVGTLIAAGAGAAFAGGIGVGLGVLIGSRRW